MKFTEVYPGKYISQKLNNGEWNYWLVIETTDMDEATGDVSEGKYLVSVNAVSPSAAGKENTKRAFDCIGIENGKRIIQKVEALNDYGFHATLFYKYGNDEVELLKKAKEECEKISFLFGFYMDRAQNRIGNTGWDFISGNVGFKK